MRIVYIFFMVALISSCGGEVKKEGQMSKEEQLVFIKETEGELYSNETKFDFGKANALIRHYDQFATEFSDHERAAEFLFKAGDLSMGMNKSYEAIGFLDRVYTDYSDYEKAPYSLFLKGFILENQVKDFGNAEKIYSQFIKKFPDHAMAESAQFSLKYLGKSPEEIIQEFEGNQEPI